MPPGWRRPTPIIETWSRPCSLTSSSSPMRTERKFLIAANTETSSGPIEDRALHLKVPNAESLATPCQNRRVASLRVVSGWYSTKVTGTFVSGPHDFKVGPAGHRRYALPATSFTSVPGTNPTFCSASSTSAYDAEAKTTCGTFHNVRYAKRDVC